MANLESPLTEEQVKNAVWAAALHFKTNTELHATTLKEICRALPAIYEELAARGLHVPGPKCPVCTALGRIEIQPDGSFITPCTGIGAGLRKR